MAGAILPRSSNSITSQILYNIKCSCISTRHHTILTFSWRMQTREVLASPLEAVSKSLDEGLGLRDSGEHTRVLERLFGDYTFDKPQLKVLH